MSALFLFFHRTWLPIATRGPVKACYRGRRFRGGAVAPFRRGPAVPLY